MRLFLRAFILALLAISCNVKHDTRPNIILINADDLGYGDLSCYGATKLKTPNIDRLAREGRLFTDAHTASAVCSPSRYGLLTGRYPLRKNFWGPISTESELRINPEKLTIAKLLKEAGYETACVGKWHLGFGNGKNDWNQQLKPGPLELGFDYYFGVPFVNSGPPFVYVENYNVVGYDPQDPFVKGVESVTQKWPAKSGYKKLGGAKAAHELYRDEEIGTRLKDKAVEWLKRVSSEDSRSPFFLYLATTNIHHPFTPAPQFKGTSECGIYGDFIHELDWIVGEVLNTVDEIGVKDNTLVIFTSDNGGMLNQGGQDAIRAGHQMNGQLLGCKFGAWEGGHRVPFIACWPGKIPGNSTSDQLISQVDMLATFAAIVDVPIEKDTYEMDSYNMLPALVNDPETMIRDHLIVSPNQPGHLMVRKGNWVYIPAQNEGGFQGKKVGDHDFGGAAAIAFMGKTNSDVLNGEIRTDAPPAQLYNLDKDPYQGVNLYNQNPDIVDELRSISGEYKSKTGANESIGWIARKRKE